MVIPEIQGWHSRVRIFQVVDVRHISRKLRVHEVRPLLITDARKPVPDEVDRDVSRQLQSEEDAVEKRECCSEGMPHCRHSRGAMRRYHILHGGEDL